jgi:hypothetical protein
MRCFGCSRRFAWVLFRSVFKELRRWFEARRLWRRAQFSMVQCGVIIALILAQVCDGGTEKM